VAFAVRVNDPPVPVTVNGYGPKRVEPLTTILSVDVLPEAGLGVNVGVVPAGSPLMVKATGALNPPVRVIVTV
jgi:hypothetical protein